MAPLRITAEASEHLCGALPMDGDENDRLTVVDFAALMLVPSLADAQGLTWHYEPERLVGMPDVTRAPQQVRVCNARLGIW